jgi:hypothetical protein
MPEALEKHCIQAGLFVDKKLDGKEKPGFAHPLLWICRRFSTVGRQLAAMYPVLSFRTPVLQTGVGLQTDGPFLPIGMHPFFFCRPKKTCSAAAMPSVTGFALFFLQALRDLSTQGRIVVLVN